MCGLFSVVVLCVGLWVFLRLDAFVRTRDD
jgi:hypothetical protein